MMNCSDNMSKTQMKVHKRNLWFRRMFLTAFVFGIIVGLLIGRLSAGTVESEITQEPELNQPVEITEPPETELVLLGEYRITAYCSCEICCGKWAENRPNGIVYGASGEELIAGVSCASTLPFGTKIIIDGIGDFTVHDRTASWVVDKYGDKLIDIYFDDHEAAVDFGLQYHNVYEVKGVSDT